MTPLLSDEDVHFSATLDSVAPLTARPAGCEGGEESDGGGCGVGVGGGGGGGGVAGAGAGGGEAGSGRVSQRFLVPLRGSPKTTLVQDTPFVNVLGAVKTPLAP
jgi:hypothetical protein